MDHLFLIFLIINILIQYQDCQEYRITEIFKKDKKGNAAVEKLLHEEGIRKDKNLDYTCAVYDEDYNIIATGSCFGNTLRCLAVSHEHQGEGLTNKVMSHLMEYQFERNNFHLFLYTKCSTAHLFGDLGFHEIVRIKDQIVFMENRKTGFQDYLNLLGKTKKEGNKIAAIVMNANPFTLGHQHLVEKACKENDILHLFIVSEDKSIIPFNIRKKLIMEGTSHLNNIIYHDSGPYIISSATFPSYFQKDENAVIESHANLDLEIFVKIAKKLDISARYVGEETKSIVTGIYNKIMENKLPEYGIKCIILPRKKEKSGVEISASNVRKLLKEGNLEGIKELVPESTFKFFMSDEGKKIIKKIEQIEDVIHY